MATSADGEPRFEQVKTVGSSERVHRRSPFDSPTSSIICSDPFFSAVVQVLFDKVTSGHRGPTPRDRLRDNNDPYSLPNSPALQAEREAPAENATLAKQISTQEEEKT
ncbi:hypothetical protein A7C99_3305 [Trichophyton rubrum]|uniref:Uncharacterized protein n=1 Tax=Trichophyton rubrum TaxID=5551 RepID=A0A178F1S4_TRIRU|nr:hypothetical protein A7C99_3305 [Trichophyton rubrum]